MLSPRREVYLDRTREGREERWAEEMTGWTVMGVMVAWESSSLPTRDHSPLPHTDPSRRLSCLTTTTTSSLSLHTHTHTCFATLQTPHYTSSTTAHLTTHCLSSYKLTFLVAHHTPHHAALHHTAHCKTLQHTRKKKTKVQKRKLRRLFL